MAEVQLAGIRIGYGWAVDLDFPTGYLDVNESVRTKLRKFVGDPDPITPTNTRAGDTITWELTELQTADMTPGTYIAEAEVYDTTDPTAKGTMLTINRYLIECDHSPSE